MLLVKYYNLYSFWIEALVLMGFVVGGARRRAWQGRISGETRVQMWSGHGPCSTVCRLSAGP